MTTKLGNLVLDRWIDGDGDGNVLLTRAVNQNIAPDDFENAGTMWEVLGTVELTTGSIWDPVRTTRLAKSNE